ncbi:MAG: hypothetical protein E7262_09110 [Lachnospiraceae bacterium]|nr:hypothetical protein [Lachnospiraceae bacterium]
MIKIEYVTLNKEVCSIVLVLWAHGMGSIMRKLSKYSKVLIVALLLIIASVLTTGAFGVYVKADKSKKYDVSGMERDTAITVDGAGTLNIERNRKEDESIMGREDTWTIMIYMDGTDLEMFNGSATKDLREIMSAKICQSTTENVNILVQTGGAAMWHNYDVDESKTQRFHIDSIACPTVVEEFEIQNMGEADTLTDFLQWGVENYPAEHMGVIFWNHGNGVSGGVCVDDEDSLMVPELEYSFAKVSEQMTCNFDFIGFDTCLSGSIEYANALAPYADYMIASANTEPGEGWNYQHFLDKILLEPTCTVEEVGQIICDTYYDTTSKKNKDARLTMAMYDLSKVDEVCVAVNDLAKYMYDTVNQDEDAFDEFNEMQLEDDRITYGEEKENMDIGSLLAYFDSSRKYNFNTSQCKQALEEMIIYKRMSLVYEKHDGAAISMYYPVKAMGISEYAVARNVLFSPYQMKFLEYMGYRKANGTQSGFAANRWESSQCFYENDFEFINYYRDKKEEENSIKQLLLSNSKYAQDGFVNLWISNFGGSTNKDATDAFNKKVTDDRLCRLSSQEGINWILPDGQELTAYVDYSLGEVIYSIPVVINDTEMTIKIKKDVETENQYEVLGVWDATINSDYEGRGYMDLNVGTVITPIYDVYNEELGQYESEYGEDYVISSDFDFLVALD